MPHKSTKHLAKWPMCHLKNNKNNIYITWRILFGNFQLINCNMVTWNYGLGLKITDIWFKLEDMINGQFHNSQSWSFITVHGQF